MSLGKRLAYETIRTSTVTGSYQAVGSTISNPASLVKMVNLSDKDVFVSTDGSTDMEICPANSFWLYDVTANSSNQSDAIFIPKGRQYSIKSVDGAVGTGSVYLVVQYIEHT